MKVKTYRGREMSQVMARIKEEFGEQAMIVATNHSENNVVEVSVSLEDAIAPKRSTRPAAPVTPAVKPAAEGPSIVERARTVLTRQGICDDHRALLDRVLVQNRSYSSPELALTIALESVIHFDPRLPAGQHAIALVGATGVGKTTTIAKLAARMQEAFGIKVGLVAADSYRVGAAHQLQSYASLLGAPCRALNPGNPFASEVKGALHALRNCDLVLIDTPGCSARDNGRIDQMTREFAELPEVERMLALPAPSNKVDLEAATTAFEKVGYSRLVITKLDESGYIGPVVDTAIAARRSLAFMTTGQRVPQDIEPATARRLAWMMVRPMH